MKYFYDRKSDSLYLSLHERRAYGESMEAAPGVVLDFDERGRLIGIDLERASRIVDVSDLALHEEPSGADAETARMDGADLRQKREQLGLSQVELARKLSVSPNTVARWERGELKIEHAGMLQLALRSLRHTTQESAQYPRTKAVHTVARDSGWAKIQSGSSRASSVHRTQAEAIDRGREIAQSTGVEHVHGASGRIRDRDSYGGDPEPVMREGRDRKGSAGKELQMTGNKSGRLPDSKRAKKK